MFETLLIFAVVGGVLWATGGSPFKNTGRTKRTDLDVFWEMAIAVLLLSYFGRCQTNSNQSQHAAKYQNLCWTKLALLGESGGSVNLEIDA